MKRKTALLSCFCLLALLPGCVKAVSKGSDPSQTSGVITPAVTAITEEAAGDTNAEAPETTNTDMTITVSPLNMSDTNGGVFEGWGTSLCWWANRVGYSDSLAQQAADLFYGENGLRLNIMRYNIGGGDDPSHHHITRTDSEVPGYLVYDEATKSFTYDWDADYNQLNVLKRSVAAAGEDAIVEVFSNSPPYFMTNSGCSSGGEDPNVTNIKDDSYDDFADYLVTVTEHIQKDLGIKVTDISPMNEPDTDYWGAYSNKQEGCHVESGEDQSRLITEVAKAMENHGMTDVIIAASDETSVDTQIQEYNAYSDEAKAVLGRINTHSYGGTQLSQLRQLAKDNNMNLWMSEVDGGDTSGTNAGEMGAGLWLGEKIISDINGLSPSAWVLWQIIDSHISKDGYNGNKDNGMVDTSGGFWGTAVADHDNDTIILTQKYYALGQFTRYIRPGATLITGSGTSLAAYDKESKELVIVALNTDAASKVCDFDLSMFKSIGSTVKAVRTSGSIENGESWAELDDIKAYDSGFIAELKENSITTFIIPNVEVGETENKLTQVSMEGAKISGSTPWKAGQDTVENAIDGNNTSFFDGVTDGWLEINLGEVKKIDCIGYVPRQGFEYRMVEGSFYGSLDGENWELIKQIDTLPSSGINYYYIKGGAEYQYIRYAVPTEKPNNIYNNEDTHNCNIAEIILYNVSGSDE